MSIHTNIRSAVVNGTRSESGYDIIPLQSTS